MKSSSLMVYKHADTECASVISTPLLCAFVPAPLISRGAVVVSVVLVFCGRGGTISVSL